MDVHDDAHDDDGERHDEDHEDHPEVLPQAANRRRKLTSLMFCRAVLYAGCANFPRGLVYCRRADGMRSEM